MIKHSDNFYCIDDCGRKLETSEVLREWEGDFGTNKNSKDVWHLTFSIKENTTPRNMENLLSATKQVLDKNFFGYSYVLVPHTHQNNPHIHILLNKRNAFTKKKIHFDSREEIKYFFNTMRNDFALALNARGFNYQNKTRLENNLQKELESFRANNLESKVILSESLSKEQNALEKKIKNLEKKSNAVKTILSNLYQEKNQILIEALEAQRDKNKIYFKKFKEVKNYNEKIKSMRNLYKNIALDSKKLKQEFIRLDNYRELDFNKGKDYSSLQEKKRYIEFVKENYAKKNLSKQQIFLLNRFEKEITLKESSMNKILQDSLSSSLITAHLLNTYSNTFTLIKKKKELEYNKIMVLKNHLGLERMDLLDSNTEVIKNLMKMRYNTLEKILKDKSHIAKFQYKEFESLSKELRKSNEEILNALALKIKDKSENLINNNRNNRVGFKNNARGFEVKNVGIDKEIIKSPTQFQ
ncbi:relaxase/mobilization nuclease domain-containing protein [Helicobacter sp. MIT 11-5569]|uniref:relaxase/mobilization nuclease domain-containing protein n=1 Tax=Helicobacter sp. MIT 11-5569 TaxID=1548151 RepID=UPI00051F9997